MATACLASAVCAIVLTGFSLSSPSAAPAPDAPRAAAELIVYQQGVSPAASYAGAADTYISHLGDESFNHGQEAALALFSGDQQAALLRFALPGLSADDTINQAILSVYVSGHPTGTSDLPFGAYGVLRPWNELEATWYNATVGELWSLAGCNSPGADRSSTVSAGGDLATTGVWIDLDITGLARGWVANPASNFGLILKAGMSPFPSPAGDQYLLRSAQFGGDAALRPKLAISYTPAGAGSPTPTPTAVYGSPTTVVFQQFVSPTLYAGNTDTFISDYGDPDSNYGSDSALRLRSNDHRASLIRFDLTSLPGYAHVYSATLNLYSQSRTNVNPLAISAHRLLRPWHEMEATWNLATLAQRWAFPGANGLTTDRSPDAFATTILSSTGAWTSWPMTGLVQDWLANPGSNYGIILKAGSGPQVEYSLVAGHYLANATLRPWLEIVYAVPDGPTPQPTPTRTSTSTPTVTATPSVIPTVVVFQYASSPSAGYTGVQDTYISREGDLAQNYGLDAAFSVGSNDTQAGLLRFDLSRIPSWVTVQSARLEIFSDGASNGYPLAIGAHRLLRPWQETGATWLNATATMQWFVAGANSLGLDRTAVADDTRVVNTLGDWYELDVTAMARLWVAAPEDNYGLVLKGLPGPQVRYDFLSSQSVAGQATVSRPRLSVAYTVHQGPTPTATNTRTPTVTATRMYKYLPVIVSLHAPTPTPTPTPTATKAAP